MSRLQKNEQGRIGTAFPIPNFMDSIITIGFDETAEGMVFTATRGDDRIIHEIQERNHGTTGDYFFELLSAAKPLFFQWLIAKQISGQVDPRIEARNPLFIKAVSAFADVLKNTNGILKKYAHLKDKALQHSCVLLYNVDNIQHYSIKFEELNQRLPGRVFMENMETGFDPVSRQWTGNDKILNIDELIEIVLSKNIRRIITMNMYVVEKFINKYQIHLLPIMDLLGVEFVIVDEDDYGLSSYGSQQKAALSHEKFRRYVFFPYLQEEWDDLFEIKNLHYCPIYRGITKDMAVAPLDDDYRIVVISNSRTPHLKTKIQTVLYVLLHGTSPETIYEDYQLFFLTMRHLVLRQKMSQWQKAYFNAQLNGIYVAIMSFLKFEVIFSVNGDRPFDLYGDDGWNHYFPQHYRGYLKPAEMKRVFTGNRYLNILMNHNFSYVESNPVTHQAIIRNMPFVAQPAVAVLPGMEGLQLIEYRNAFELNALLNDANKSLKDERFQSSFKCFRDFLVDSEKEYMDSLASFEPAPLKMYLNYRNAAHSLSLRKLRDYLARYGDFLEKFGNMVMTNEPQPFDMSQSPFWERDYVQKILQS